MDKNQEPKSIAELTWQIRRIDRAFKNENRRHEARIEKLNIEKSQVKEMKKKLLELQLELLNKE